MRPSSALLRTATEPARQTEQYDFGNSELARRMSDIALNLRLRDKYGRLPPPDIFISTPKTRRALSTAQPPASEDFGQRADRALP